MSHLTNCQASSLCLELAETVMPLIVSAVPRLPAGPFGWRATFHLNLPWMTLSPGENWPQYPVASEASLLLANNSLAVLPVVPGSGPGAGDHFFVYTSATQRIPAMNSGVSIVRALPS